MGCRRSRKMLLGLILLVGCAENYESVHPNEPSSVPIGVQLLQVSPQLKGQRFINLLNFENPTDAVFVSGVPTIDSSRSHTGRTSLRIASPSNTFSVKLSSILGSKAFPGDWTMAGAYFYSDSPAQITTRMDVSGRTIVQSTIAHPGGGWMAALVDLANANATQQQLAGTPTLNFQISGSAVVWFDDVILIDNMNWILGTSETDRAGQWVIYRRGWDYICAASGKFAAHLPAADTQSGGWNIEETNALRARFSSSGKNKSATVYSDGRSYWDGEYRPLTPDLRSDPAWQQQHALPAEISIPEDMGRLNRNSAGDQNNDGYNESRASYMILATGPRLTLTITPRSVWMNHPMLEITGLPPGEVLANIEGRLIEKNVRQADGTLLIEIPTRIERPTSISIRIQ